MNFLLRKKRKRERRCHKNERVTSKDLHRYAMIMSEMSLSTETEESIELWQAWARGKKRKSVGDLIEDDANNRDVEHMKVPTTWKPSSYRINETTMRMTNFKEGWMCVRHKSKVIFRRPSTCTASRKSGETKCTYTTCQRIPSYIFLQGRTV